MSTKILYLMQVDWGWIKQRPHFIAENLSKYYDIFIVCPYNIERKVLTENKRKDLKLSLIFHVPFRFKFKLLYYADNLLMKMYIQFILSTFKPDYIWITYPDLYNWIPSKNNCKIIYDCMDDAGELSNYSGINSKGVEIEIDLIENASLIFVSSENLIEVLNSRKECSEKTILIRNAFGGDKLHIDSAKKHPYKAERYKICYVGTISSWFDFESLIYCLDHIGNIEFHIVGPVGIGIEEWKNERMIFHGPINHDLLYENIKDFDCMIMPFKLNKLIMSVDPVKIYEYVNYFKPIVSIYYKEVDKYSQFVSFYTTKSELLDTIVAMIGANFVPKYSEQQRNEFLSKNTWDIRVKKIIQCLEEKNKC